MPFIDVALDDAAELEVVEEGEYELQIAKAEDGESKAGNLMTTVYIKILDAPIANASLVRHWITYPDESTPPEQRAMRLIDIKRFLVLFNIIHDGNGFNSEDLVGATARCLVIQEEADDGNVYNRLRLPKLKKGETVPDQPTRRRR